MGGIIVVDFIDMNEAENLVRSLYERMCANMQKDRARQQHSALKQIRTDANYTPTGSPGHGREHYRNLSDLLW